MRLVLHYLARLIRRWGDPAFPKLSTVAGEDYWQRRATTFIERTKILHEPYN